MTAEILNAAEIARIAETTPYEPGQGPLLAALRARYPQAPINLVSGYDHGCSWATGIVDAANNRVTDNLVTWIDQELASTNGDARAVWLRHKDKDLIKTEMVGGTLMLAAPYGEDPDAFFQIEITVAQEMTTQWLFNPSPSFVPEDRGDLIGGSCFYFSDDRRTVLSGMRYKFEKIVNMRNFLRLIVENEQARRLAEMTEMSQVVVRVIEFVPGLNGWQSSHDIPFQEMYPEWEARIPPAIRFFKDWQESSAGLDGHRLCDHWWMSTSDWTDPDGKRYTSLMPRWADADGGLDLPVISPSWNATPYGVMERLQEFDKRVGYLYFQNWFLSDASLSLDVPDLN